MTSADHPRGPGPLRLALALAAWKGSLLLLTLAAPLLFPGLWSDDVYYHNFHWPPGSPPTTATRFETWDGLHYLFLATEGYGPGRWSIAFFPLYPWLIRALAALPAVSPLAAALLLANGLSIAGCLLLHRLLSSRHAGSADATLLVFLAYPGALFFQFPYTESLFLLLAVWVVAATAADRPATGAAASFLLALTRPNGVLIGTVAAYGAFRRWRRDRRLPPAHLLALAAPALGFGAYLAFMRSATGDAFAGFAMQDAFNAGRSLANLIHPLQTVGELFDVRTLHAPTHSLLDRAVFLLVVATLAPLWRIDRLLFWYALPMVLIGPLSGSFVSYTRFAAVFFPCHLVVAHTFAGERRRPWLWLTIGVSLALQMALLIRHVSFRWAG